MDPADFYSGIVVDAYARLKSSTFQAGPYLTFVRTHGEPALEVGCGDGEPLIDLRAAGLEVDGVDSSADMVERCRANAAKRGLATDIFHQRVEALELNRRYSSIYFAGPTFNLLADDETAMQALQAIREHLTDDGAALIPLWIPGPTPIDELGVTHTTDDGAGHELRYTPLAETHDREQRTRATTVRYERVSAAGAEVADREWIIHWQTPQTISALCPRAGLRIVDLRDDDTGDAVSDVSTSFTATVQRL